jgi:putative effector of murein hydrolase LrgA (UPF0299 family)
VLMYIHRHETFAMDCSFLVCHIEKLFIPRDVVIMEKSSRSQFVVETMDYK